MKRVKKEILIAMLLILSFSISQMFNIKTSILAKETNEKNDFLENKKFLKSLKYSQKK